MECAASSTSMLSQRASKTMNGLPGSRGEGRATEYREAV